MSDEILISVKRSDLIYMKRTLDSLYPLIEELTHEGNEDPDVLIELDDVNKMVAGYLG